MELSDPVPDEAISIPPGGTFLPKHKGMALIFTFCTEFYYHFVDSVITRDVGIRLTVYSQHGASDALRKLFGIDIRGTSIHYYYKRAESAVRNAGFEWDKHAVAQIIRSQVNDEATFKEVVGFLTKNRGNERLEPGTRWLMEKASTAFDAANFPSYGDTTIKGRPKIEDPILQQSFEEVAPGNDYDNKAGAKALERSPPTLPPKGDPWYQSNSGGSMQRIA